MDFPAPARANHLDELSGPPMEREEVRARVEYLFPRTETNWSVGKGEPRRATGLSRLAPAAHWPARRPAGRRTGSG